MSRLSYGSVFLLLTALVAAAACSDSREQVFNAETGRHDAAGWLPLQHALATTSGSTAPGAPANTAPCKECHGADLLGGVSGVSCAGCHLGGPTHVHPEAWGIVSRDHMPHVQANGTASCANLYCHGTSLNGAANSGPSCSSCHLGGPASIHPAAWSASLGEHASYASASGTVGCANAACHGASLDGASGSGPSCSSCHMGGPTRVHPASWTNRYTSHGPFVATGDAAACSNQACHGPQLEGVQNSGPSCGVCHDWPLAPGIPVVLKCGFCHGIPPNGAVSPNRAGAHARHLSLNGVTCSSCHSGAGGATDNPLHPNLTTDVIFDPVYNSKSGVASFDGVNKTCTNISCHGGPRTQTQAQAIQTAPTSTHPGSAPQSPQARTPTWYGGTLNDPTNISAPCVACHTFHPVQGTEHNNYFSGGHFIHMWDPVRGPQPKYLCSDCHDFLALAASHFTTLHTATMEGSSAATIRLSIEYNGLTCNKPCHVPRDWSPALVPVP